jgi:aminopeptidase YwaD
MLKRLQSFFIILLIVGFSVIYPVGYPLTANSVTDSSATYLSIAEQADGQQAFKYLEKLCSREFEGRQAGTKGGEISSAWIGEMFQGFGLKPADPNGKDYFQSFPAPCFNLLPEVSFMLTTKEGNTPFVYKQDFIPSPSSGSGTASGAISFVGYGITNPEKKWDDYEGIDVKNKIAMVLRRAPVNNNFSDSDMYFATKINNAKNHGAIGVIVVEKAGESNPMSILTKSASGSIGSDIPAVFIPTDIADQILSQSSTTVRELQKKIDELGKPMSISIKAGAYIKINMSMEIKETRNVIGYIPAQDPSVQTSILVTAHYDHLGIDLVNGDLYPGANDNGSGTAALIESARVLTSNCYLPAINIVFIAFSGEEEGLLGSSYYIENPLFPLNKTLAVLNMDMVGTGEGEIYAGTNFKELTDTIMEAAKALKKQVPISKSLVNGGSDQLLFARNNVPAVFFIRSNPTGIGDYHSPNDTIDTVNPENLAEQTRLILMVCSLYTNPKTLIFDTKSDYWFHEKSVHGRIVLKAKGSPGIRGMIQNKPFTVSQDGSFQQVIQLKEGSNLIQIEIFNQEDVIIFERMISILAKIDKDLDADFNFDREVNFSDLMLFSKLYPVEHTNTVLEELCDLNQDQAIDEKDFILLKKSYDYKLEK